MFLQSGYSTYLGRSFTCGNNLSPSSASSNSAAGAGGSKVISKYYQFGYIDPGYIE